MLKNIDSIKTNEILKSILNFETKLRSRGVFKKKKKLNIHPKYVLPL